MNILNKVIPNRKVKIRLIRDDFSSPILGNVWVGREAILNISTAQRFVDLGYAEFVDEAKPAEKAAGGEGGSEHMTLDEAIESLNPDDEAHWTKGGLPDLNVLKELTGGNVTRKDVDEAAPDFNREKAAEKAAGGEGGDENGQDNG